MKLYYPDKMIWRAVGIYYLKLIISSIISILSLRDSNSVEIWSFIMMFFIKYFDDKNTIYILFVNIYI
jgi:hypothetical protein